MQICAFLFQFATLLSAAVFLVVCSHVFEETKISFFCTTYIVCCILVHRYAFVESEV